MYIVHSLKSIKKIFKKIFYEMTALETGKVKSVFCNRRSTQDMIIASFIWNNKSNCFRICMTIVREVRRGLSKY